ncbi:MAG: hypothetical protein CMJ17_09625, partial [Phenylobacterium sp.]|nr:hypothetical protein [Phenylobacterium sp.]
VALGAYPTVRIRGDRREDVEVTLYLMRVTRQLDRWPERGQRRRRWMTLPEAAARLGDPGLVELLNRAAERLEALAPAKPAKGRRKLKAASGR